MRKCVSTLAVLFLIFGLALQLVPVAASAQPSPAQGAATQSPPVAVKGWRYVPGRSDLHVFRCEQTKCGVGSRMSYRLYAAGKPMTLDQFRGSQEQIVKALEQKTPGLKTTILGIDADKGAGMPRAMKVRRLTVSPAGANEYVVSALLFGSRASASLISSASEEKVSNDNYAQFALAMTTIVQTPASR